MQVWIELKHHDEMLQEKILHDEEMEVAAKARAAAALRQTELAEESNRIRLQQRNAERVTAAAAVVTAYQTRKLAKATQDMNGRDRDTSRY